MPHLPIHLDAHTLELIIAGLTILGFTISNVDRLRKFYYLIYVMVLLLRFYKHIAPMAKHYFDTHPMGKQLRRGTKVDNKITQLIKKHQLPYDNNKLHDELAKKGAEG